MPLRLNLRPYEQIMINGAVITNIRRRSFLAIHNHARIIPGKFIMQESSAVTPVRRIYFAAQMAYICCEDLDQLETWIAEFDQRLRQVFGVLTNPDMRSRLEQAAAAFGARQFYKTLRLLQDVIEYEDKLFALGGTPQPPSFGDGLNIPPGEAAKAGRKFDGDEAE